MLCKIIGFINLLGILQRRMENSYLNLNYNIQIMFKKLKKSFMGANYSEF